MYTFYKTNLKNIKTKVVRLCAVTVYLHRLGQSTLLEELALSYERWIHREVLEDFIVI